MQLLEDSRSHFSIKTVQNKRHSVQSFLRRTMSKCLSEIIMSKQDIFHLMLGIPIIYCSHKQIKLISKMSLERLWSLILLIIQIHQMLLVMRLPKLRKKMWFICQIKIDAYGICIDQSKWKPENEVSAIAKTFLDISLLKFCSNFKVLSRVICKNKISTENREIIINFILLNQGLNWV